MKTFRSAREVLGAVEQALAPKPRLSPRGASGRRPKPHRAEPRKSPLDAVAGLLRSSRGYFAVTIYLEAGGRLMRAAAAGPAPRCESMRLGEGNVGQAAKTGQAKVVPDVSRDPQYVKVFSETRSELVRPIKIGTHVIGVIDVESDRVNGFAYQDRVLLQKVAAQLARFLSGRGKYLARKAREAAQAQAADKELPHPVSPDPGETRMGQQQVSPKQPQTERQERLRAAAGEKARS